jgi:hypothetical protein
VDFFGVLVVGPRGGWEEGGPLCVSLVRLGEYCWAGCPGVTYFLKHIMGELFGLKEGNDEG